MEKRDIINQKYIPKWQRCTKIQTVMKYQCVRAVAVVDGNYKRVIECGWNVVTIVTYMCEKLPYRNN